MLTSRQELIKVKGLQVAPAEIEAILLLHPDVQDAAVAAVKKYAHFLENHMGRNTDRGSEVTTSIRKDMLSANQNLLQDKSLRDGSRIAALVTNG